jgi:hypothetical protein
MTEQGLGDFLVVTNSRSMALSELGATPSGETLSKTHVG